MTAQLKKQNITPLSVHGSRASTLAEIYQPMVNLVCWQRRLADQVARDCQLLLGRAGVSLRSVLHADEVGEQLSTSLRMPPDSALLQDVQQLVMMFADLFDLKQVGLRFELVDKTMCPRFHTDRLTCRLVTTYSGEGTEWLEESNVDRNKLGPSGVGIPDQHSGVVIDPAKIQRATAGEVLLLKGYGWPNSPVPGIVHRSPPAHGTSKRLLLTLDFAD